MTVSMIPSGQPHGERQKAEVASEEAGLPTTAPQAPSEIEMPQPIRQATARGQGEFDAIQSRTPSSTGQLKDDQNSRVVAAMEQSPSPVLRDIARRLRGN